MRTVLVQVNHLDLGGTQLNAVDFARAVEPHGYRSVLYGPLDTLPRSGPTLFDVATDRGVSLEGYDRSAGVLSGRARSMARRAEEIGADIVHVYGTWGDPRTAYWGPCRLGRRPFVHTVYEMSVDPSTYRHTSLIVGTRHLHDELSHRPGPTALISPPVDVTADAPDPGLAEAFRNTLGELSDRFLVVIVSRLAEAMKAYPVEVAIAAARNLADLGIALVVAGSGDAEIRLRRSAVEANAAAGKEVVRFLGPLLDPRPAYAAADLTLGMGGSAARALAFGSPVVVQGDRGTSELFEPASADSLFRESFWSQEPSSSPVRSLERIIRSLVADADRRRELSSFGRRFATANFGLDAMAARLASVYDEAMQTYGPLRWSGDLRRELPELQRSLSRRLPFQTREAPG